MDKPMPESDKVNRIKELYGSLSEEGKELFIAEIAADDDLLARLLTVLVEKRADQESAFEEAGGFVDFLKRVKE